MRFCGVELLLILGLAGSAMAETVRVEAVRDATLIEDPAGARANGSGGWFFAGRTSQQQNGIRRALVRFDVAGALPQQAIVESVSLTLYASSGNPDDRELRLHRLLADWSEGPSSASGGSGAPSEPGDVTWLHTAYDGDFWTRPGGFFVQRASAGLNVGASGIYTWENTVHLLQDVRLWNSAPERNFGWILIGDETTPQNAKRLASRENPDPLARPVLEITYRLPGRPARDSD